MTKISREDIQIIARHSNWSEERIDEILKEQVYPDQNSWNKFLRLFFLSLGVGFTTAGIIFFFAYNWNDLHKFVKLGLVEGLLIVLVLTILLSKLSALTKNTMLTGAAMLVGVLFAVFGQVYQSGANAYDFFLGWTMFIAVWVLVANFAPLWLIFITLINTTIVLYGEQVAYDWSEVFIATLLFVTNVLFLLIFLFGNKLNRDVHAPTWFLNTLALAAICCSTAGLVMGIFEPSQITYDRTQTAFHRLLIIASLLYAVGIWYGIKEKDGFYLAVIPFSLIIIFSCYLIKLSAGIGMFFSVALFVLISVTLVISNLIKLQKDG